MADAADDGDGLLDGRLGHGDGLEAALERGILFDVLAVLVERGRADDLDLAAGQGGLEDVGSVHGAFGITRADEIVDLVDDKDDIAELFDLLDEALHAAFELAAELRTGNKGREIHQVDLFVLQLIGDILCRDASGPGPRRWPSCRRPARR